MILKEFEVDNFKNWITFEFPKNFEFIDYMKKKPVFNLHSTIGTVLSVGHNDSIFELPYRMTKRVENLRVVSPGQLSKADTSDQMASNYVYLAEGIMRNLKSEDKTLFSKCKFRLLGNYDILQAEYIGYKFNDPINLMFCFNRHMNAAAFERLEFLGDALIESMSLYMARKVLIRLGLSSTPELLHSIKVLALSNLALANLLIFHGLHRFIKYTPEIKVSVMDYISKKKFDTPFKESSLRESEACPKFLGDTMEALCGAIFLDGGWQALIDFFGRIASPIIYFVCKYFDETVVDLIHDITAYFTQRGKLVIM